MQTLLTMRSLPLLLLLLQPLALQVLMLRKYLDFSDELEEEFEDYLEELHGTGPTKPPTKKSFQKQVIIDYETPLYDPNYCAGEMMAKNIHNRLYCKKEHFFLQVAYETLQKTCSNMFVACKSGVRRCHRSKILIKGVYCNLTSGIMMPSCEYISFYKQGYALITCRWQDDIQELIPEHVNDILEISHK